MAFPYNIKEAKHSSPRVAISHRLDIFFFSHPPPAQPLHFSTSPFLHSINPVRLLHIYTQSTPNNGTEKEAKDLAEPEVPILENVCWKEFWLLVFVWIAFLALQIIKVRDAGNLLTRAGFTLPGVDIDEYTVRYDSALELIEHLRAMGETNALLQSRKILKRETALATAAVYESMFAAEDGSFCSLFCHRAFLVERSKC